MANRILMSLLLCAASMRAIAAPLPPAEQIPVDLRRTTLVVRDIDRSLPLYRDALGMKVIYDQLIGGTDADGKPTAPTVRLVLLRANDDFIGVLGLMQRLNPTETPPPPVFRKAQPGGLILVFNVRDLETRFAQISSAPNVKVSEAPTRIEMLPKWQSAAEPWPISGGAARSCARRLRTAARKLLRCVAPPPSPPNFWITLPLGS